MLGEEIGIQFADNAFIVSDFCKKENPLCKCRAFISIIS